MTALATARGPLLTRNRNFALVWLGQVLSQGGTRVYQIALLWWLLGQVPHDVRGLAGGAFLVVGAVPALVLVRRIGRVLDVRPSRTVMLRAELIAGAAVAVLAVLAFRNAVPVWSVYVVGAVVAVCQAFFDPCLTKATPELVDGADVERAVGFETSTQSVANFAGAAFGAALLGTIGFPGAVAVNAATYGVSALCLLAARFRTPEPMPVPDNTDGEPQGGLWRFIGSLPRVRPLLICFAVANFFSAPTLLVLPLYTKSVLHGDAGTLSRLEAALWFGLLFGAFAAAHLTVPGRTTRFSAVCIGGFAVFLGLPGVIIGGPFYLVTLALAGVSLGVSNVKFVALFQRTVPDGWKGRFFAVLQAAISTTFPVAFLAFGAVGDAVPAQWMCLAQGAGLAVIAIVLAGLRDPEPFRT
jgi:hypothetical protein